MKSKFTSHVDHDVIVSGCELSNDFTKTSESILDFLSGFAAGRFNTPSDRTMASSLISTLADLDSRISQFNTVFCEFIESLNAEE